MEGDGMGGPTRAIRLTIVQKGSELRVVSSQSVRMLVPPGDPTYGQEKHGGAWFELRDAKQECVYRRVLPNMLVGELEAPSGDPERPFTRVPTPDDHETVIVVLVPEIAEANDLVFFASPRAAMGERARPLAAVDLRKPEGKVRMLAKDPPAKPTRSGRGTRKKKGGR
jgi:hypothetical protein